MPPVVFSNPSTCQTWLREGIGAAVSTAGSALGVLVTSFYFVLWWEVSQIMLGLTVALALCGVAAITAHRLQLSSTGATA